jgi:hypothetical protein
MVELLAVVLEPYLVGKLEDLRVLLMDILLVVDWAYLMVDGLVNKLDEN